MITTIRLVNYHTVHVCVCVLKIFKIYFLSNFQVYKIVLLTTVTILYIRSLELIHLKNKIFFLFDKYLPISTTTSPWQSPFYSLLLCVQLF